MLEEVEKQESKNENPNAPANGILEIIQEYTSKLKELILDANFKDKEEEIIFFKYVKPQFISIQLYYLKLEELDLKGPKGNTKSARAFYEKELKKINEFFSHNRQMVDYCRSGAKEMDGLLFLRGIKSVPNWLVRLRADTDERFSTIADYQTSRILAFEKIQGHIIKYLNGLKSNAKPSDLREPSFNLKWTGESINLIEIAYGIWLTGQINNGNATVSEIVRWLESSLEINIGRAYRRWTEISRRDDTTKTKYLDRMIEMINTRLVNEDDLKRQKRQSLKNNGR